MTEMTDTPSTGLTGLTLDTALRLDAAEAARRLGHQPGSLSVPELARALRDSGASAVVITGNPHDWLDTPHATGWLTRPRTGPADHAERFERARRAGWVVADAAVLARLPDGAGALDLPVLSVDDQPLPWVAPLGVPHAWGVYAIVDSAERVRACAEAGVGLVQLRIKARRDDPSVEPEIRAALDAVRAARGTTLVVNDHWRTALNLDAPALHLGQEDWLALRPTERTTIAAAQARGLQLGMSSHSLWELCRARGAGADLIACGPVWPTTTKDMPWHAQGLDNLAWWVRLAGRPVIAIGGVLAPEQLEQCAATGAATVCVVRGLGDDPRATLPRWQRAWDAGQALPRRPTPAWPHATLAAD
ncbi:Phosphomethylpyrimidine kinase / thiamine-phosphate pyrophosphorylase [Hydrogenophaga intermedia]|uniref:Phosphomethylpyrimidine kinase / thiamine-phosphate pyrophosphorylase n=2 Tax=Comamonadaceae TaxID=80864 RepID=A0A1L1PLP7_HYDIT|nr:Phosphomethylpyrimidine kinase / thiamine-phosphate pyrophosphorylase [Hydrogenophaga intermedia]